MSIVEKIRYLFPGEDAGRICISETSAGSLTIVMDAHGMKCWQAERSINNLINLVRRPFRLTVIHGYNHGTAILDMVRNKLQNNRISARYEDMYNRGITYLAIA